jgi:hypothetical protein
MPKALSPSLLYRIDECPDLMADACICDERGILVFASLWGRDTVVQELLGRLTLGSAEHGLERFHLISADDTAIPVAVGNVQLLEKRTSRVQRTLFGSLIHLWIFDTQCKRPDKANARALTILQKDASNVSERIWRIVQDTCPFPLLDHWKDAILELLRSSSCLAPLPFVLGELEAHRISLDVPLLEQTIGDLIRSGLLDTVPRDRLPESPLRLAA